jgi:hypothetical protein
MCNNYPNCNCPSCTQCQDCTQVTPTCNCTTTCTCTTEQFTEECPNGLQSTDCLVYTGDNLKNCQNNDFLLRGTNFNTFLSQLWETVKCAATATTDTIDYVGTDIKDCTNTITIVTTNTPVTTALNNIWNYIKCWKNDLQTLITNRQPIWTGSSSITVGSSQPAPYNNINTALAELAKYHFNTTFSIYLEDGNYGTNNEVIFDSFFNDKNTLIVESLSGIKENVIIKSIPGTTAIELKKGNLLFRRISLGTNNTNPVLKIKGSGTNVNLDEVKLITNPGDKTLIDVSESASINLKNCTFVDSNTANTSPFIYAERQGNVTISGGTYTVNRNFFTGRNASLYLTGSSINFTNLVATYLFVFTANSTGNIINTTIINSNVLGPQSTAFYSEQSTLYVYNAFNVTTYCIEGFQTAFNILENSSVYIYNQNNYSKYNNTYFCVTTSSNFNMFSGHIGCFDYTIPTLGVYNLSSKVRLNGVYLESNRVINSWNNADSTFENCTFVFNTTWALANPTQNKFFIWEDNGCTSTFANCTLDLNNLSTGIRSSVNGTQFWIDSSNFINVPGNARLISDFNSIVYAPLVTGITKLAGTNSLIY